jgi:hypothetical protein
MTEHNTEFAKDLLRGAEEIAQFLYGDPELRRKVYHLVATSNLPVFKLGSMICGRKSVLLKWVEDQEERYAARTENRHRTEGKNVNEKCNV